jgi:hypothetical protein
MRLNERNVGPAMQRLNALPQTKHVFAVRGRSQSCVLVWVQHDGARRNLHTHEQVMHALNPTMSPMDYEAAPQERWPLKLERW